MLYKHGYTMQIFFGSIAAKINGIKNIYWSLHLSNVSFKSLKFNTYLLIRLLAVLSYFIPKRIISCSNAGYQSHIRILYNKRIFTYIPLGFNYDMFYYDQNIREDFRNKFNISDSNIVIGCVARWDLQKDHNNLFKSISLLRDKSYFSNLRICLAGYEMDENNINLISLIKKNNLDIKMFIMLGAVNNINNVYNGIDILILSSIGEAFPNVIAEALLTNLPVISTNVGDVKAVFNEFIEIVPPSDSIILSKKLNVFLNQHQERMNRSRIENVIKFKNEVTNNYSIENMLQLHNDLWIQK